MDNFYLLIYTDNNIDYYFNRKFRAFTDCITQDNIMNLKTAKWNQTYQKKSYNKDSQITSLKIEIDR